MSCRGRRGAGVVDHLSTLLLAEARGANWREALVCVRVNGGKFGRAADVTLSHPRSAMVVGSVVYPQPSQTLRGRENQPFVWNSKEKYDPVLERRNEDSDEETTESRTLRIIKSYDSYDVFSSCFVALIGGGRKQVVSSKNAQRFGDCPLAVAPLSIFTSTIGAILF